MSATKLLNDIKSTIEKSRYAPSAWYVGIAADLIDRLENGHQVAGVSEMRGTPWIYGNAESDTAARRIEAWFVTVMGTDGGQGGGDHRTTYVYAYLKTRDTNP
mgnify:CR=1 FL=1